MSFNLVQTQFEEGRVTALDAIYKILLALTPERVDELRDIHGELSAKLRDYVRNYDPMLRSTAGNKPTEEHVELAKNWFDQQFSE
ncbi:hypothetical protein [Blastopirellula retiformator]|uniref:Uncharacterized protein n=1 Tax=Blastopirellula retiformator TaxID=2527970 RepID=A0A5C5UV03_9BACT|nr:hypothetical protein [Blastopirellula retiformator]TWT29629.1 hypothetical protein Enr8_48170 [Blastopirellula retiformator]